MTNDIDDANTIIDTYLGGRDGAARLCGVTHEAVKKWRDGIPPKHWQKIVDATGGKVTYAMLAGATKAGAAA